MAPFVLRYWSMRSNAGILPATIKYRALPTGHSDVVFNLSDTSFNIIEGNVHAASSDAFFVGMADWHMTYSINGSVDLFGVQFRHEVLRGLMRFDMHELTGQQVDLSLLLGKQIDFLTEQLRAEKDNSKRINLVEKTLAPKCIALNHLDLSLPIAIEAMLTRPEANSIRDLASLAGLSERQLERTFKRYTGLTPKRFSEVGRFMKATRILNSGSSFAEVAYSLGYSDQSHFNRSFKKYCGLSPGEYLKEPDVVFIQDEVYSHQQPSK